MTAKGHKILNMVLALLVSIGAWTFVVYNYDPRTIVTYNNVPVSYTGEEALAKRGLAVADESTEDISVTLSQLRIDSMRISADDISVTADVSECAAGDNSVSITVASPADTSVTDYDSDNIEVSVGRAKSDVMGIDVIYANDGDEDIPENAEPVAIDLSQTEAEAICTGERLLKIKRIAAELSYSEVGDGVRSYTTKLVALDEDGEVLPHVVIVPEEISLDASAGFTKEVSLNVPVTNKKSSKYSRQYTAPQNVVIKGPQDAVDMVSSINAKEVDISHLYENTEIPVEYELPEGISIANESLGQNVSVTVTKK